MEMPPGPARSQGPRRACYGTIEGTKMPLLGAGALPADALSAAAAGDAAPAGALPGAMPPPAPPPLVTPSLIEKQVESVVREMEALRGELEAVRRRDEALNTYLRKMDEELRLAARLQQDFLPKSMPQVGRVRFHTLFRPAGYVSGDLYDVMRLDERRCGFYMADAVGHGVPAALLTMFIKNALVTKEITAGSYRLLDPGTAMARLNDALVGQNLSYAT